MSVAVAELATRWRLADPRPAHCPMCLRGADSEVVFYELPDVYLDRGSLVAEDLALVEGQDRAIICATHDRETGRLVGGCTHELLEVANYQPEFHQRQFREIRRLELASEYWREKAERAEKRVAEQDEFIGRHLGGAPAPKRRRA